jgi:hypothetical protein
VEHLLRSYQPDRRDRCACGGVTGRDAAFATELAYGTLRIRGLLDAIIANAADRPVERIDPLLLDLLRLPTSAHTR